MKFLYKSPAFLLGLLLLPLFQACVDQPVSSGMDSDNLEGEALVSFDLSGIPLESAMTRSPGDAIKNVRNLYVFFYSLDDRNGKAGELAYAFTTDASCQNAIFDNSLEIISTSQENREDFNPGSGEWAGSAETKTVKVKTDEVLVGRGRYKIYVVANVDGFSASDLNIESFKTIEKLKNYSLKWNANNIASNDAMFGFFTEKSTTGFDVIYEDAPEIILSSNNVSLHAWMKRAASKVTIAFDGSQLNDNVNIYIKKVRIKDIPLNCKLGAENKPASLEELILNGEEKVYDATDGISNATRVSKREPYFPDFTGYSDDEENVRKWREQVHSENSDALYFFENCQGISTTGSSDDDGSWKAQTDTNNNGKPDDAEKGILKDTKTFGSYIEVEAYYTNDNFGAQTKGHIIYRFMLGMNTTNDFNARRNNHYKLTLCFKNNANNADWHIDYNDEPGIYIPETIYVSYTYNTPSKLPVRVVGQTVSNLSVTLDSSNWYPEDNSIPRYTGTTYPSGLPTGFLSLTYDEAPRVRSASETDASQDYTLVSQYWNNQPNNSMRSYIENGVKKEWSDLNEHGYKVENRTTSEGQKVFEADIPLFTRPLTIYKTTSWTGANPYYSSERLGQITVRGTIDGNNFERKVNVKQVRRVENPTGIYRRHDNASKFDVVLMARSGEGGLHNNGAVSYQPLKSEGAWRAIVYRTTTGASSSGANSSQQEAWFTLTKGSQKVSSKDSFIQGDDDSEISFTYTPNGTIASNQVRTGIIKIEYNDYTCTHYIFVRQGYAPMQIEANKVYWHTFNLYSGNQEVTNPCEAGSLFLRGNLAPAILDSNTQEYGVPNSSTATLQCITDVAGNVVGNIAVNNLRSSYTRKDFSPSQMTLGKSDANLNPYNIGRIPDVTEWASLLNENSNALINRAFGVLYADGVNATVSNPDYVFSCVHSDVNAGNSPKGMRGTFVYNTDSGRNIFLPIGASGYGRRKFNTATTTNATYGPGYGQLQYGFGDSFWLGVLTGNIQYRPLLYNLYRNEGAIYWGYREVGRSAASNNKDTNAWDINYKSYDFDYMDAAENATSACYIRLVQDNAP